MNSMNNKVIIAVVGLLFGFVFFLMFGIVLFVLFISGVMNDGLEEQELIESENNYSIGEGLSEEVLSFEDDIADELDAQGVDDNYLPIMLAILQQESGGNEDATNGDIFQSSESKCGRIGCINDTDESIEQAVTHIKGLIEQTDDVETVIQAYNFGEGYIDYVEGKSTKKHSQDNAVEFSQRMMQESSENYSCVRSEARNYSPPACYGDILYTETIMDYVEVHTISVGGGDGGEGLVVGDMALPLEEEHFVNDMNGGIGSYEGHPGYDFTVPIGTPVYSLVDGTVVETESNRPDYPAGRGLAQVLASDDLGNFVRIRPDDSPNLMVNYMHLTEDDGVLVEEGDTVEKGEQIGRVGNSGKSTAPHLHLDVLENNVYDIGSAVHWYDELLDSYQNSDGESDGDD